MFRTPPIRVLSSSSPVAGNDTRPWADGFFFLVKQSALDFGLDRREPKKWRLGLSLWRDEPFITVLPSTTRGRSGNPNFFEIPREDVRFKKPSNKASFLFYRYETVNRSELGEKVGIVGHPLRLRIMEWIVQRYSGD